MNDTLHAFLRRLVDIAWSGDFSDLDDLYSYPLVIYVNGKARVEHDSAATRAVLERRHSEVLAGFTHLFVYLG